MIGHHVALLKREALEHRSIFVTPAAIGVIIILSVLAMIMFASGFAEELHLAIFGASNLAGDTERQGILTGLFIGFFSLFSFAVLIQTTFYSLDCLYAERKDKSILFWRSLPITDAEVVISKLLTAMVVIPLVAVAAVAVTHLVSLVIISIWIGAKGGDVGHLIWGSAALFDNWVAAIVMALAGAVWMSPFIGWFMFVSAWTKRMPFLTAFMPLVVIPLIEIIFLRSTVFVDAVFKTRLKDIGTFFDTGRMNTQEETVSLLAHIDVVEFLFSPSVWIGLVVCGLFTTAAIYMRRYRDDS